MNITTLDRTPPPTDVAASPAAPPVLEVGGLTVRADGIEVLRDLSFTLPRGRILGLIGELGAGKSMVAKVIGGQLPTGFTVASGTMRFGGSDLLGLKPGARRELLGRRIAFVPQEPMSALNPVFTIGRQFAEHLERLGVPRSERRAVAAKALAEMRLQNPEELLDKYPFQLSGGMCQRVLIALAFASQPELVIADEPTAALDVTTQVHIIALLRDLQRRHGTGVLFITHDLRLAGHLCDEIAVLYAGNIVEYGPARGLLESPAHPYTRALAGASPNFLGEKRELQSLTGNMPGLSDLAGLNGCRFTARCAAATEACSAAVPPLALQPDGRLMRCIRTNAEARVESPVTTQATPAGASVPIIEVAGVSKTYRGNGWRNRGRETHAVRDVSLTVMPGEFVGIVGESGSGKSTLGRLVMGLEECSNGQIALDGVLIGHGSRDWERRIANIQLVFQDPRSALNPRRRVSSLVTQPLEAKSYLVRDRLTRATELLGETGMAADTKGRYAHQLSGGQRQRVNIARALCATPRLLVADEIVSGLDVSVQAQIMNLLFELRRQHGIALLMISHDLAVVRYLCSKVLVMCGGEVVESGATEQVFAAPQHPYTRELIAAVPTEDLDRPWPC